MLLLRGDVALLRLLLLGDVLRAAFAPARSMLTSFGKKTKGESYIEMSAKRARKRKAEKAEEKEKEEEETEGENHVSKGKGRGRKRGR